MDDGTFSERDGEKTKLIKRYNRQEVVEDHDRPRPE